MLVPKTLPLGLNFVERVSSIDHLLLRRILLLLRCVRFAIRRRVPGDDAATTITAESESRRTFSEGLSFRGREGEWCWCRGVWGGKVEVEMKMKMEMRVQHLDFESVRGSKKEQWREKGDNVLTSEDGAQN